MTTLDRVDRWWRAANYLSVGQIYLVDNPLLDEPLQTSHIKPRLLGHWGTTPGLNFIWAHVNRLVIERDLSAMFVCGPGHGGPAMHANAWLEGTTGELDRDVDRSVDGMRRLFRRFSFPYGVPSHAAPETPGSIHEGGELGYCLAHAYGAAFDAPGELVVCVIGDGEAETGPLAASWQSSGFLHPVHDGTVLPVLHLNGYKIANPTVLARIPESRLRSLLEGYGHRPWFVSGGEPGEVHQAMRQALDEIADELDTIRAAGERPGVPAPTPVLVLRTPKGWTGPAEVDGQQVEGHFRSHQVPLASIREDPDHLAALEAWLRSYRPEDLFTDDGAPDEDLLRLSPVGDRRMSANPRTNGGALRRALDLPDIDAYALRVDRPAAGMGEATRVVGGFVRDVIDRNPADFRLFGPDEIASNRLSAVFEVTDRVWLLEHRDDDVSLGRTGRAMEVLSEHTCQGWLEGYLLTGRHGLFTCYEAFVHIVDSMFNQHAKWIDAASAVEWRRPIASLNYLLTSHVWRQDHNGFTHQDPGFLDVVANKKADVVRIYLAPDANCLLTVLDRCLRSTNLVNVVIAGKQSEPQYLTLDEAIVHCDRGLGTWEWAGSEAERGRPDVVLGCAGDVPTMEAVAAARLLAEHTSLSVRVVNVVDLMTLQSPAHHPHGIGDTAFDSLFTADRPVVFAFHGYPWLIHRLTYKRANHENLHVRGYVEEGSTTTPFDMVVRNELDRYHLAIEAIDRLPHRSAELSGARERFVERLTTHDRYVRENGEDMPEVRDWHLVR